MGTLGSDQLHANVDTNVKKDVRFIYPMINTTILQTRLNNDEME